jgi:hypothetical protein
MCNWGLRAAAVKCCGPKANFKIVIAKLQFDREQAKQFQCCCNRL